jgi:putative endonuclease
MLEKKIKARGAERFLLDLGITVSRGAWGAKIVSSNLATPTKDLAYGRSFLFMVYTVYILFSKSCGKFYSGQTQHFENRLIEHNAGEMKSIKSCTPWLTIWKTEVASRSKAVMLEKKIKARGAERFLLDLWITVSRGAWGRQDRQFESGHPDKDLAYGKVFCLWYAPFTFSSASPVVNSIQDKLSILKTD